MNDFKPAPGQGPDYAERKATRVRVFTPSGVVEGDHHHPPGVRLSDALRNSATGERYMLLTDVSIRTSAGEADTAPMVLVSTAHASVIVPLGEE